MTCTTFLHDSELNQPLPDAQVQALLDEVRRRTGGDWQVVPQRQPRTGMDRILERPAKVLYGIYVYVGGVGPWQQINFWSGRSSSSICLLQPLEVVAAYLLGIATGLDEKARNTEAPAAASGVPVQAPSDQLRPQGLAFDLPPLLFTRKQLQQALEFFGTMYEPDEGDDEAQVSIALRDAGPDVDGEPRPRGLYIWMTDQPQEGSLLLDGAVEPEAPAASSLADQFATAQQRMDEWPEWLRRETRVASASLPAPKAPAVAAGQTREARMVTITPPGTPPNAMIWCDPEIVDLVKALNDAGLATVASCSGHGHRPGLIVLRDGRALMVFDSLEHAKPAHDAYPLDINGDVAAWATKAGVTP